MSLHRTGPEQGITDQGVRSSREFGQVQRRFRRFAVPTVLGLLAGYFLYVVLAAFFPDLMGVRVVGEINVPRSRWTGPGSRGSRCGP